MSIVRQIVDRCHVGQRDSAVLRYVVSRLRDGKATWRALPRDDRRRIAREAVDVHRENRATYRWIMFPEPR